MAKSSLNRTIVVLIIAALAFGGSYLGMRALRAQEPAASLSLASPQASAQLPCRRIVSLAPSITETLFALGLGDNVVAVTRYCEYPAEARRKVRIGGFYDANYEAILSLAPDLVILLPEQENIRQFFQKAGFSVLVVNNKTVPDIFATIEAIGRRCGVAERSAVLAAELGARRDRLRQGAPMTSRPRVMVSIGGNMGWPPRRNLRGRFPDLLRSACRPCRRCQRLSGETGLSRDIEGGFDRTQSRGHYRHRGQYRLSGTWGRRIGRQESENGRKLRPARTRPGTAASTFLRRITW